MVETPTQKLTDNEATFRAHNESVQNGLDDLEKTARSQGWTADIAPQNTPLHFLCECSDENCSKRISMTLMEYGDIHKNRLRFIVLCGHEVAKVEDVVERRERYCIVQKRKTPTRRPTRLYRTDVDNA